MREAAVELAQNTKTGATVAAGTTATGLGTLLDWIPDDIGKLATLVGIVLSSILIYAHFHKTKAFIRHDKFEMERELLELALLRQELENGKSDRDPCSTKSISD